MRLVKKRLVNSQKLRKIFAELVEPAEDATFMHNRNPRNLEMMRIGYRPNGYSLDLYRKCFWNQLVLDKTSNSLTAKIQHYTGHTILECSTDEWSLAKQLYRSYDMAAYINFGRIFARRCLEAGIIQVEHFNEIHPGGKLEAFIKEVEKMDSN